MRSSFFFWGGGEGILGGVCFYSLSLPNHRLVDPLLSGMSVRLHGGVLVLLQALRLLVQVPEPSAARLLASPKGLDPRANSTASGHNTLLGNPTCAGDKSSLSFMAPSHPLSLLVFWCLVGISI